MNTLQYKLLRRRKPIVCSLLQRGFLLSVVLASSLRLAAQNDTAAAADTGQSPVMMSAFTVNTTQDKGYITSHSATGMKTDEELMNIPQAVTVVTRDLITDTGYAHASDILQFAGVGDFFRGETYVLRGSRIGYALVDELPWTSAFQDNVWVDSYEVIRGPAAVFYPTVSISGVVLKTTRKPMPVASGSFNFSIDQWGIYRAELDATGPIVKLGHGSLNYRVDATEQDGHSYFINEKEGVQSFHPSLQYESSRTRVLIGVGGEYITTIPYGSNFVEPNGHLSTAYGRNNANFPIGDVAIYKLGDARVQLQHTIDTNWETKAYAMVTHQDIEDPNLSISSIDWGKQTISYGGAFGKSHQNVYNLLNDYTGKYSFANREFRSTFGTTLTYINSVSGNYGTNAVRNFNNLPLANPGIQFIRIPQKDDYFKITSGSQTKTFDTATYFVQSAELIPERLTALAGVTYRTIESDLASNLAAIPYVSTNTSLASFLSRYGVVVNIIKKSVSVYAGRSTIANPQTQITQTGAPIGNALGTGSEVGIKTNLFNERIVSTIAVYKMALTNQAVFAGTQVNGVGYYIPIGGTNSKGWDMDLAFKILPNWQVVGAAYSGTVLDQNKAPVANTIRSSWSLFTKYDVNSGGLKGLSLGAGMARFMGHIVGTGGMTFPGGASVPFIYMKSGNLVNLFVNYRIDKHWSVRLAVDNVLNDTYAAGAQAAVFVDPAPPRTSSVAVRYNW